MESFIIKERITLSASLSYNPAKYGGIQSFSPKGAEIVRLAFHFYNTFVSR